MKIFAVILALMTFSLSVSAYSVERCGCAVYQTCEDIPNEDGNNSSNDCSPFHQCGTCGGFTVPVMYQCNVDIPQDKSLKLTSYTQPNLSAFCGDIWQPPKI